MFKKFFYLTSIIFIVFVFVPYTESKQEKLSSHEFVYLYNNNCGYCIKFNPIFNNIKKNYENNISFSKINVSTDEGQKIATNYGITYVPYVIMHNIKNNQKATVAPSCLLKPACVEKTIKDFYSIK